jgi:hypothetical protein
MYELPHSGGKRVALRNNSQAEINQKQFGGSIEEVVRFPGGESLQVTHLHILKGKESPSTKSADEEKEQVQRVHDDTCFEPDGCQPIVGDPFHDDFSQWHKTSEEWTERANAENDGDDFFHVLVTFEPDEHLPMVGDPFHDDYLLW